MATITINIPQDKEDWVLNGFAMRFGYQARVDNPDFNDTELVDAVTNPLTIDNPESLPAFCKRLIIHLIKDNANQGHNQVSLAANAVIANDVILD